MLILLFVFTLIRHLQGAPTANIPNPPGYDPPDIFARDDTMSKHFSTRGVNDIVISCLATIFACTWTAIHPNIPDPCDSGWEIFKRQIITMVYAILAPEMVTGWALRQHLAARRIAKEYNETIAHVKDIPPTGSLAERFVGSLKGWFDRKLAPRIAKDGEVVQWTITHGFFIQMGGFLMCEGGNPIQIIRFGGRYLVNEYKCIAYYIRKGDIEVPRITEGEIEDRSKGDGLTKAIVVLQTTWFITQCIVRWSSSLPVTELEVLTLGFAMLNGITYALWWHKPQSVRLPVYLEKKGMVVSTTGQRAVMVKREQSQAQDGRSGTPMAVAHARREAEVMAGQERSGAEQRGEEVEGREGQEQHETSGTRTAAVLVKEAPPPKRSFLARKLEEDWSTGWQRLWRIPYRIGQAVLRPISKMAQATGSPRIEGDALRVPMFFSSEADDVTVWMASSAIASIFGLVHFIPAFFLDFPSRPEMLLWRISAGIITVQPLFVVIVCLQINGIINTGCGSITVYGAPLYIIARLTLIVLALLSLHGLYGNALVTVDWISFIPHF